MFPTVPDAGSSYNPSLKDHQDLLWKAAIVEINKDKAEHKIEYHTTRMFPTADKFPTKESWIKEMSEGVPGLDKDLVKETPENEAVSLFQIFNHKVAQKSLSKRF